MIFHNSDSMDLAKLAYRENVVVILSVHMLLKLLLWIIFVLCVSHLSCFLVYSL